MVKLVRPAISVNITITAAGASFLLGNNFQVKPQLGA